MIGWFFIGAVVLLIAGWLAAFCLDPEAFNGSSRR